MAGKGKMRKYLQWLMEILSSLAVFSLSLLSYLPTFDLLHLAFIFSANDLSFSWLGLTVSWNQITISWRWFSLFIELSDLRVRTNLSQICSVLKSPQSNPSTNNRTYSMPHWFVSVLPSVHILCNQFEMDCLISSETSLQLSCQNALEPSLSDPATAFEY
jgi:hypothetical protein